MIINTLAAGRVLHGKTRPITFSFTVFHVAKEPFQLTNISLLKGKLSAGVTCTGLLYNNPKTTISGDGWKYVQRNRFSGRELQFSIAWNFSAGKKINKMRLSKAGGVNRATPTF